MVGEDVGLSTKYIRNDEWGDMIEYVIHHLSFDSIIFIEYRRKEAIADGIVSKKLPLHNKNSIKWNANTDLYDGITVWALFDLIKRRRSENQLWENLRKV